MGAHYSDLALYGRVLRLVRPYWPLITATFLVSLLSVPLALLSPLALKIAVDSVIGSHPLPPLLDAVLPSITKEPKAALLAVAAALLVAVATLTQLQQLTSSLLRAYTGERMLVGLRGTLFRHAHRLSLAYHDSKGTSDAVYRIQNDTQAIQYAGTDGIIPFVTAAFTLVAMIYVIVQMSWQLAVVGLAISPVLLLISYVSRKQVRAGWRQVKSIDASVLSIIQEVLGALRVVKAFGQEEREEDRYIRRASEGMRARLRVAAVEGGFGLLVGLATATGTAVVLYVGVRQAQSGAITLGEFLLVMSYLSHLYSPLRTLSSMVTHLQHLLASAERVFSLLDEPPDVPERPDPIRLRRARGSVAFQNVSFAYDPGRPVLRQLTFEVAPGQCVGLVGPTGAGKTTIIGLLARFYDPSEGHVLFDGLDLRDYQLADLRRQFAIVLQEPVLFSTTIGENIAYARSGASGHEVLAAARAANIHEFIARLPDGYETVVGERGMRLSGGERQRISLARAFLKDAPVLVLDEPTSSVDMETESTIMEAIERLTTGRTTLLITHRPTALRICDVTLVIEDGGVGNGTPAGRDLGLPAAAATGHPGGRL